MSKRARAKGAHISEIVKELPIVAASKARSAETAQKGAASAQAQAAQISEQKAKYQLTHLDARSSEELAAAEEQKERCRSCSGLNECQYNEYQRGLEPVISTQSESPKTRTIYLSVKVCRYRAAVAKEEARAEQYKASELPYAPQELEWLGEEQQRALEQLVSIATSNPPQQIYLYGPSGSGKTLLMSIIGSRLVKAKRTVRYITAAELIARLRAAENYPAELEKYTQPETLIIEDLGLERKSEYIVEQLSLILSKRAGKRTIISSALSAEDAAETYMRHDLTGQLSGRLQRMNMLTIR